MHLNKFRIYVTSIVKNWTTVNISNKKYKHFTVEEFSHVISSELQNNSNGSFCLIEEETEAQNS